MKTRKQIYDEILIDEGLPVNTPYWDEKFYTEKELTIFFNMHCYCDEKNWVSGNLCLSCVLRKELFGDQ